MSKVTKADKRVPDEAKVIGANIKFLREATGLSQYEIGHILDISYQQVQKYERGENRFPVEKLHRLKHFYNVPYEIFFRGLIDVHGSGEKSRDISVYVKLGSLKNKALKRKIENILHILLE